MSTTWKISEASDFAVPPSEGYTVPYISASGKLMRTLPGGGVVNNGNNNKTQIGIGLSDSSSCRIHGTLHQHRRHLAQNNRYAVVCTCVHAII